MPNDNDILDAVVVPVKYLSKFWRSLDLSLINCEIEFHLSWSRYRIISEISRTAAVTRNSNANPPVLNAKFYVPVVTLTINDNISSF